jgi:ribosomal-protein-alanine N-acetyltransferase
MTDTPTVIETARLRLRPFTMRDLDNLHAVIYSDPQVTTYLPGGEPWPLCETRSLLAWWVAHWEDKGFGPWAVLDKMSDAFLGDCGLMLSLGVSPSAGHAVELLYALGRESWGKGYASEAARAALRHGFEQAGLKQIVAVAVPENTGSRRVMEKLGMTFEGISARYYNADLAVYTIARDQLVPDGSPYFVR